ncbi:DnaA regulatory inactivator Hda [Sedimenticola selenatireducens]|uniref:DnaA regulatory inactivator Hda n=1 Tax=Sedimenticola selenatireducens TaxID=191960 RepID=A0A558E0M9_9GAMM|nr:DnaA regulatory inactivator Hda [Sedimenticola selenatireducens]TVO75241.1 DnaA regulatory inactivator Hda [Sedimenticola selenatireducens]TVT66906.1 MAG: DnaA regulatory inactivator Hda [Sedimenticola selenatireducens]
MSKQLALGFTLPEKATLESYVPATNEQAVADMAACARGHGEPFIYLWGSAQTGKSHLLQAATQIADEAGRSALYIPLDQAKQFSPEIFDDLEQLNLICLDGVEQIAGDPAWEQGLFNLFNRIREQGNSLLVSAQCSPLSLPIKLPDLSSRLSWGLCYQLQPLDDQQKVTALIEDAARRGLEMSEESAGYILRHTPRDMGSLRQLLEELDQASLEAQRRLTIPFIKAFLQRNPT